MLMYCRFFLFFSVLGIALVLGGCFSASRRNSSKPDQEQVTTYSNPVFEPVLADPSVIRDPKTGKFYAYGTQDNWADGQGSRLVPILESLDMVKWNYVGNAFTEKPAWKKEGGIWAPDIHLVDGKYHLYYSYSTWGDQNPGVGLAIADAAAGPFVDQGKLFTSHELAVPNSIDPFFIQDKGKKFLFWGSFSDTPEQGIYVIELSADGKHIKKETKHKIAAGDFEASTVHKRNGYYYFIGSKGSCCEGVNSTYHVLVARSKNLLGPYVDKQGKDIKQRGSGSLILEKNDTFVGTGHTSAIITDDRGKDWIYYHGIEAHNGKLKNGTSRRVLMLDEIVWEDGWPSIRQAVPSKQATGPVIKSIK